MNVSSNYRDITDLLGYTGGEVTYISGEANSVNTTLFVDIVSSDIQ